MNRKRRPDKTRPRRKVTNEVSAGGIVYTKRRGKLRMVLLMTKHMRSGKPYVTWRLPKGHPAKGENLLAAARREVAEETGVLGTGGPKLGTANFYFTHPVTKKFTHKYVHYFLFKKKTGSTELHDREYEAARWFTVPEALKAASFKNDQLMIQRAITIIKKRQARAKQGLPATRAERFEADEETVKFINRKRSAHD